jgi:hypothetical protein
MNDDAEKLRAYLADPSAGADSAWLERMKERYPFFTLPRMERVRAACEGGEMSPQERQQAIADMVLSVADSDAAARVMGDESEGGRFDGFYPPQKEKTTPSTTQTIDKFLATYGSADASETETLEKLIFNPVADYSQQLARREAADLPQTEPTGNSRDDRINRFILSVRSREESQKTSPAPEIKAPAPAADNSLLSESLAKIYIKTRRYERAYEILNRLSLDFPEKNAYFADQLRFLRKLMVAESIRRKRIDKETNKE